jgi:hypothetical protein
MTKWQETVHPTPKHSEGIICPHCNEEFGIENTIEATRNEQAKVSFLAGAASRDITVAELKVRIQQLEIDIRNSKQSGRREDFKELRNFVAQRGAGAGTATESNAYSIVLAKMDELEGK